MAEINKEREIDIKEKLIMPFNNWIWRLMLCCGVLIYGTYSILVHMTKIDGKIPFNSASTVFMAECLKLVLSLCCLLLESINNKQSNALYLPPFTKILPFILPAIFYCVTNNLGIHIQPHMDPASYQVLSNMKIFSTAIFYRIIMKKLLTYVQWLSLVLLFLAACLNSYGGIMGEVTTSTGLSVHVTWTGLILITFYCSLSGLSGVISEYALKGTYGTSIHIQNILLYAFGITLNISLWLYTYKPDSEGKMDLFEGYNIYVWLIIISQALVGLIMSGVMKHGNNITRLFVIGMAMVVATTLSVLLFHLKLNVYFSLAFVLAFLALFLYHKS